MATPTAMGHRPRHRLGASGGGAAPGRHSRLSGGASDGLARLLQLRGGRRALPRRAEQLPLRRVRLGLLVAPVLRAGDDAPPRVEDEDAEEDDDHHERLREVDGRAHDALERGHRVRRAVGRAEVGRRA